MEIIKFFDKLKANFLNFRSGDKFTQTASIKNCKKSVGTAQNNTGGIQQAAGRDNYIVQIHINPKNVEKTIDTLSSINKTLRKITAAIKNCQYRPHFGQDIKETINHFEELYKLLLLLPRKNNKLSQQIKFIERIIKQLRTKPENIPQTSIPAMYALRLLDSKWREKDPSEFKRLKAIRAILITNMNNKKLESLL